MKNKIKATLLMPILLFCSAGCGMNDSVNEQNENTYGPKTEATSLSTAAEQSEQQSALFSEATTAYEDKPAPVGPQHPILRYGGKLYYYLFESMQIEIDGSYYEISGEKSCLDAEKIKNECEHLGKSIPIDGNELPENDKEVIYSDEVYDLYKIDENQILLYSHKPYEVNEEDSRNPEHYGTYYIHCVAVSEDFSYEQRQELLKKYRVPAKSPEESLYEIGENAVLSQDSLNGFSASLEIIDIQTLPSEDTNEFWGKKLFLRLTDESGKTVTGALPNGKLKGLNENSESGIQAECAENSTKIFEVEQNGKKEYIVMQYSSYNPETKRSKAVFAVCDMSVYEDSGDQLMWYKLNCPSQYYPPDSFISTEVSNGFAYTGGTSFSDSELGFSIEFDIENHTGLVTTYTSVSSNNTEI